MWKRCILILALTAGACLAQTETAAKFYKLDFILKELDGSKTLSSRSYSLTASTDPHSSRSSLRTGSKVPVTAGSSFSYIDVGVSIDCWNVKETAGGLSMSVTADVSSVPPEPAPAQAVPVVRQNRWGSDVVVPLKKPTVIFSSDDLTTKHVMQLEVTATAL